MADSSTKVVYAALAGNILVASSKFGAAAVSGSSAMLTEAIHSAADTTNQVLLLIGNRRSRAAPDATHQFGYGMEVYFWTFVVAVIVLLAGGVASLWQGVTQLRAPEPIRAPTLTFVVLALSLVFESASLAVGYREYKRQVHGRRIDGEKVSLWRFIVVSKDPNLYESLLEDVAAVIGIVIAAVGVLASVTLGWLWADGAASIAIGLLLIADSFVIAEATRSLVAGEGAAPPVIEDIRQAVQDSADRALVTEVKTLQLGPRCIMVALTMRHCDETKGPRLQRILADFRQRIEAADTRIYYVYFSFDPPSPK